MGVYSPQVRFFGMDVSKILAELSAEREQIEEAIGSLERLAKGRGAGRHPNWMAKITPKGGGETPPSASSPPVPKGGDGFPGDSPSPEDGRDQVSSVAFRRTGFPRIAASRKRKNAPTTGVMAA